MAISIDAGYDTDYQNYQRNIFSKLLFGTIQLALTLTGTSSVAGLRIQYKVIPHGGGADVVGWTDVGSINHAAPGTRVIEIEGIPQGGWYNWNIRTVDANGVVVETVAPTNRFGVGDVYFITGQSNGEGMFTVVSGPTVNAKTSVFHGTSWAVPTTEGAATFTNHMQLALVELGEDIPVSAVNLCLGGSATLEAADYVFVGHWEETGARPIFDFFQRLGVRALRYHKFATDPNTNHQTQCRGVVYWQGEAEASETVVTFGFIETAQYLKGLLEVYRNFSKWMPTQTDKNTVQVQIGRLQQNSATESPDGMNTAVAMTREAHFSLTQRFPEARAILCEMMGISKGADGVHHDAAQHVDAANNIAYACRKGFGILPDLTMASHTRLPGTTGPIIVDARWTSTTNLRVTVKHDIGNDITVPSSAHECFQLVNAYGKGGFIASAKVSATEFDLTINPNNVLAGSKYCFAYCNDAMPNLASLIADNEGYYLHPTNSEQGDRNQAVPDLIENILAGDDSFPCVLSTINTVELNAGDGASIEPGDTVYVSDRIGFASRGYRRVLSVTGDIATVTRDFDSIPQTNDFCRFSNTINVLFLNGRHGNGGMVIDNPQGGAVGLRGRRIPV